MAPKEIQSPAVNRSIQKVGEHYVEEREVLKTPAPKNNEFQIQDFTIVKTKSNSITSRRGILLAESVQSKRGDYGQVYDSVDKPGSDASFRDYQSGNTLPKRIFSQPVTVLSKVGCPVVLHGDAPQYIVSSGNKIKLKAGDVCYLSEDLID